jgi:G3E family GTPase
MYIYVSGSNIIPRKWGGIFGQEWISSLSNSLQPAMNQKTGQQVQFKQLPITIVVGGFGSGKTSLLQHMIETQERSSRVAIVVNSTSEVDMDGALLQQSDNSDDDLSLKVIELNSSCICCSNVNEILKEVRQLADSCLYDYCIIEAAATVDLGALIRILSNSDSNEKERKSGNSSNRNYFIDTTIAVVDAVNCLHALKKRDGRGSCADIKPDIIENIIYNQIKVAELVVVNRCDQLLERYIYYIYIYIYVYIYIFI